MRKFIYLLIAGVLASCSNGLKKEHSFNYDTVDIEFIYTDSVSIRAIERLEDGSLAFAGSNGVFGLYDFASQNWNLSVQTHDSITPSFRATGHTLTDFFMLSIDTPALLYKTGDSGTMELVYKEDGTGVFYDSLKFWNDDEGIAIGDPTNGCMSIIITRDGGLSWEKLSCDMLPKAVDGEAAFAASDTNIEIRGNKTWVLSGGIKSRVYFSPDKGRSWEVYDTPLTQGTATTGGYSLDFYDDTTGFIIGGDYTKPNDKTANKAITRDGGKTWQLVATGEEPGYKSCVQYVPESNAQALVSVGFTGTSYSKDAGQSWKQLSDEGFYTLRFINKTTAYAAGKHKIAVLTFKDSTLQKEEM